MLNRTTCTLRYFIEGGEGKMYTPMKAQNTFLAI